MHAAKKVVLWENQHSSLALVYHLSPLLGQRLSIGYSNEILLSGKGKVLQYLLQQCGVLVVDWVMAPQCWPQSKSEMETGLSEHLCQWNYKYLKRKIGFNWNIAHCSSYLTATVTYLNRSAGGPPLLLLLPSLWNGIMRAEIFFITYHFHWNVFVVLWAMNVQRRGKQKYFAVLQEPNLALVTAYWKMKIR